MIIPNRKNLQTQPVYNSQGLFTVDFEILPGRERNPRYRSQQAEIKHHSPKFMDFWFPELPKVGGLLKKGHCQWCVRQIIFLPIAEFVDADDLFSDVPAPVAILQVSFHGLT